ncbi:MAG: hypothetical protein GZ087_03225 [Flavobacterium sp.]|nr:hypothetical protein [Flavobacterium sp.]
MAFKYSNNIVAVEIDELVPRFWTYKNLYQELWRYKDKPFGIKRIEGAFKEGKQLIDFDSLKIQIQEAIGDPRRVDNPLENYFEFDADAVRYYSRFKRAGNSLEGDEQKRYIVNASVMKAVMKLEQARTQERINLKGSLRGITATLVKDVENFNNNLLVNHKSSHNLPASEKQFKKVLNACKMDLYYPLIKDPEGGKINNARKVDDQTEMIFNGLFKNQLHKPTSTEVARSYDSFLNGYAEVYNEATGELYDPKDFKSLSNATIISYINKWENKIATHKARSGDRQVYMGNFKPHHQMDLPTLAGSIISIDDRQPPFVYNTKNDRVWFYLGVDIASQCFTTFVYGKTKEGIIVDFYRQMVRNYTEWGFCLPHELECESSLNSSFKDTLLRPGNMFQEIKIEANNARGKYIERMNGKLRYEVEKSASGWLARPTAKSEANQLSAAKKTIIPYEILVNERLLELEQWNNSPHPEHKLMSRWDYFEKNQNPNLKSTNWQGILPTIGYKTPTSCNGGYVKLQGKKRAIADDGKILTGEALIQQMRVIEGKEFDVYWIDGNDGEVLKALVYMNDKFICEVMEMPRYNRATIERTEADSKALKLQSAYVMSVDAFEKRQRNRIDSIQIIDNTPKTVNSNFKIPNLKRYTPEAEPVEVFADEDQDDDLVYIPKPTAATGWRANF